MSNIRVVMRTGDTAVIDAVAQVNNNCKSDDGSSTSTAFLPELRASSCQIHHRKHHRHHGTLHQQHYIHRSLDRNAFLNSTRYRSMLSMISHLPLSSSEHEESKLQVERDSTAQNSVQAGISQYKWPTPPKENIKPEDFVSSWLQYGSNPYGNHFPDILSGKSLMSAKSATYKSSW